ncbi:hypothetical protein [Streptosporangium sp. NPDC087985]|uniref:hypothetical protein n=1 Tax=Streptosporangium sp. NPDC087985 TaxID=3366196 RepID=UPI0038195B5B
MRTRSALRALLGLGLAAALTVGMASAAPVSAAAGEEAVRRGSFQAPSDDTFRPGWQLKYRELFDKEDLDINMDEIPWTLDNFENVYDTISDDDGETYWGEMGLGFGEVIRSFRTWTKTKEIGEDNWLTVALSGRQQDLKSGKNQPERPGVFHVMRQPETGNIVAELRSDDPTAGAMIRNTKPMPPVYRMEYTVTRYEMGGDRFDPVTGEWSSWTTHPGYEYGDDGEYSIAPGTPRWNGFTLTDALGRKNCKSQHPWPDSSTNAYTTPRCGEGLWNPLNYGGAGYNGLHALTVTDVQHPMPRNLHFWHYHRKVLMDQFATDPDRDNNGRVCNSETGVLTRMQETHKNGVNPWVGGRMNGWNNAGYYEVGRMAGQSQRFFSDCNTSIEDPDHPGRMIYEDTTNQAPRAMAQSDPRFFPYIPYTFAVERSELGYTLEWSGMFQDVGWHTYRYYRPFITNNNPVWRYNAYPGDHYDGRYNGYARSSTRQFKPDGTRESTATVKRTWPDQWHANSAYPDFVMMGVEYTNSTEGWLQFDDVRLYEPADNRPPVSILGKARVDNWFGKQPQLDIEVINLEETVPNIDITVTTDYGTQTFTDVRPDAHPNARFKVNGSIPDGVAHVTATKGDQTYTIDVPYKGIDVLDLSAKAEGRCTGQNAMMTYSVTNTDNVDATYVTITTPFGAKTFDRVKAGHTVKLQQKTLQTEVPAGTFTVTGSGPAVKYPFNAGVEYPIATEAVTCG